MRRIEAREGRAFSSNRVPRADHPARVNLDVLNGVVLVGSDAHIWPGPTTVAMRAFIRFAAEMKPRAVILNGDVMDFPGISRHPQIGWEERPSVADEIAAARTVLEEIEAAVSRNCKLVWTLGNHDSRFESIISARAPELAKVYGVHLKDHFSQRWQPCWSAWINNDVVVKHRYKGGFGATRANTLNAGTSIVTGHLHSANVRGLSDYRGTRWGVDTGCLADPSAQAFVDYTEDNPLDWRSGFGVLTFLDGILLQPELALAYSRNSIQFRGKVIECQRTTQKSDGRLSRSAGLTLSGRTDGTTLTTRLNRRSASRADGSSRTRIGTSRLRAR